MAMDDSLEARWVELTDFPGIDLIPSFKEFLREIRLYPET